MTLNEPKAAVEPELSDRSLRRIIDILPTIQPTLCRSILVGGPVKMRRIMTEAEAVELIAIYTANGIDSITLYISFTSAYLATAYFAGQNLTRFQVLSASGLFCLGAIAAALTCVASVQAWDEIMRDNRTVIDSVPIYASNLWLVMMPALFSAGILVSLYFMWNVRHPRKQ